MHRGISTFGASFYADNIESSWTQILQIMIYNPSYMERELVLLVIAENRYVPC